MSLPHNSTMNQSILICGTCNRTIQRNSYLYKSFDTTYCSVRCRSTSIHIIQQVDPNFDHPQQWKLILSKYLRRVHVGPEDDPEQSPIYTDIYINYSYQKNNNNNVNALRKNQSTSNLIIDNGQESSLNCDGIIINVMQSPTSCSSIICNKKIASHDVILIGFVFIISIIFAIVVTTM